MSKHFALDRAHVRFRPDPGTLASVQFFKTPKQVRPEKSDFKPEYYGLVVNEAQGGCGLILILPEEMLPRTPCYVQLGKMGVLEAEVRWTLCLDAKDSLWKVGIKYLE